MCSNNCRHTYKIKQSVIVYENENKEMAEEVRVGNTWQDELVSLMEASMITYREELIVSSQLAKLVTDYQTKYESIY